jgi:hypothetical protein
MSSSARDTSATGAEPAAERIAALAALAVAAAALVAAAIFAHSQSVWLDETTQLSGLALPLGDRMAWLAGAPGYALGVPPDRMPPLSYLIGGLWAGLFGLGEAQMRAMGVAALALTAPALWLTGRRIGGSRAGLLLLGVGMLTPNVLMLAPEIRAYPLFLLFAAWMLRFHVEALVAPPDRLGPVLGFAGFALLAGYTHFFGLVAALCLGLGLLADRLRGREGGVALLLVALALLGLWAGLLPFVRAAFGMTETRPEVAMTLAQGWSNVTFLLTGIAVSQPHVGLPSFDLAHRLATAALVALGLAAGFASRRRLATGLALPLVAAFLLLGLVQFRISGVSFLALHYNLWMLPVVGCLMALALPPPGAGATALGRVALALGGALVLSNLAAAWLLVRHAPIYAHGPGDWLAGLVGPAPQGTVIVHDATAAWAWAYFPMVYAHGPRVVQVLAGPGAAPRRILPEGLRPLRPEEIADARRLVLVAVRNIPIPDLGPIARGAAPCRIDSPLFALPAAAGAPELNACGYYAAGARIADTPSGLRLGDLAP